MTREDNYKYTERIMYRYEENCRAYETLQGMYAELEYYGDLRVQTYSDRGQFSGEVTDRVMMLVHRKLQIERKMKKLKEEIKCVRQVYRRLSRDFSCRGETLQQVMEHVYFGLTNDMKLMPPNKLKGLREKLVMMVQRAMKKNRRRRQKESEIEKKFVSSERTGSAVPQISRNVHSTLERG